METIVFLSLLLGGPSAMWLYSSFMTGDIGFACEACGSHQTRKVFISAEDEVGHVKCYSCDRRWHKKIRAEASSFRLAASRDKGVTTW